MTVRGLLMAAAMAGAATLLGGATQANWNATVAATDAGHRIGNPEAKVKLIEFMSYTCPHCAQFAREADAAIKLGYLAQGQVNIEYRHLIRDPVDLTVGMLVNCGPVSKFAGNHDAFILSQDRWIGPLATGTDGQKQRWRTRGAVGRKAVATDFKFYDIMQRRGYGRAEIDRCLSDAAMEQRLSETSAKEWDRPGVDSTPTFAINGLVMPGTHTWRALEPQLKEFL